MTLPAIVDRLEDLPEAVRAHYVATGDGRFRLDAEGVEDVAGLKSALEKERAARKALKAELAERGAVEETGRPVPDESLEAPPPEGSHSGLEPDVRRAALEARLIEAEALAAVQGARGVPELLLPILRARLVVADDATGNPVVRAIDETGAVRRRAGDDGEGAFLTVADLVEDLRADPVYGRAFDGSGKGGSGAPTAGRGEAGPLTVSADDPRAIARHVADIAAGRVRVA